MLKVRSDIFLFGLFFFFFALFRCLTRLECCGDVCLRKASGLHNSLIGMAEGRNAVSSGCLVDVIVWLLNGNGSSKLNWAAPKRTVI